MSMFNEQTICMDCAAKERERPDYKAACDAEIAAVRAGNRNFKGSGLRDGPTHRPRQSRGRCARLDARSGEMV